MEIQRKTGTGPLGTGKLPSRGREPSDSRPEDRRTTDHSDTVAVRGTGSLVGQASALTHLEHPQAGKHDSPDERDARIGHRFLAHHEKLVDSLPRAERAKVQELAGLIADPKESNGDEAGESARELAQLIQDGTLFKKDSDGHTVLDDLASYVDKPLAPGIAKDFKAHYKRSVLQDVVRDLAHPGSVKQGARTFTCTTTSVEILLDKTSPGDFAKFALGLAFDGKGVTPGGATVPLDTTEFEEHQIGKRNGRGALDSLIQGSLYAYAKKSFSADGQEAFGGGRVGLGGGYGGKTGDGEGLSENQVAGLMHDVFGIKTRDVPVTDANKAQIESDLEATLAAQESGGRDPMSQGVPVGIKEGSGVLHEILLTKISGGNVSFVNPADGGTHEMSVETLMARIQAVTVPDEMPPAIRQAFLKAGVLPRGASNLVIHAATRPFLGVGPVWEADSVRARALPR